MVALERLEECRSPDRFAGWLMTIVRNRSRKPRSAGSFSAERIPCLQWLRRKGPTPERVAEQVELEERLSKALRSLPAVQREIVLLHDLEGWKHREIAERLGIPSGTVRSHLHFARRALQKYLSLSEYKADTADTMERA